MQFVYLSTKCLVDTQFFAYNIVSIKIMFCSLIRMFNLSQHGPHCLGTVNKISLDSISSISSIDSHAMLWHAYNFEFTQLFSCCCFQIGANAGVVGMTKEHLGLALALGVPVFVVVTKIDMCPPNILQETLQMLHKILKSPGCRKMPVLVQTVDDVVVSAMNFTSERFYFELVKI